MKQIVARPASRITVWYRRNEKGCYTHNHIEYGWNYGYKPTPKFPTQLKWLSERWLKQHTVLDNGKVLEL